MNKARPRGREPTESEKADPEFTGFVGVLDPPSLGQMLKDAIAREFDGNLSAAARAVGIPQPTLYRITRGLPSKSARKREFPTLRISIRVWSALSRLLPRVRGAQDPFLTSRGGSALALNSQWIAKESLPAYAAPKSDRRKLIRPPGGEESDTDRGIVSILKRTRNEVPHVALKLLQHLDPHEIAIRAWIIALGGEYQAYSKHPPGGIGFDRGEVVVRRMLSPLLAGPSSGWIERTAQELSRKEFRRFIEASWMREEILMNRDSDVERAQRLERSVGDGSQFVFKREAGDKHE